MKIASPFFELNQNRASVRPKSNGNKPILIYRELSIQTALLFSATPLFAEFLSDCELLVRGNKQKNDSLNNK